MLVESLVRFLDAGFLFLLGLSQVMLFFVSVFVLLVFSWLFKNLLFFFTCEFFFLLNFLVMKL